MKLSNAVNCSVIESGRFSVPIMEDGEGPRWKFGYNGQRVTDPNPDILLLGAYRHPGTGNNLIGGVNLHYITPEQRDEVAQALPEIMKAGNLKSRYWAGRKLVPDVFENYYRTYNADSIRGVQKDVMYPKYGYLKTAQSWFKKKLGGIFKGKDQRQKEAEPKYPNDLQSMQDTLDQAVLRLAKNPPADEPPDSPEMQAARRAFHDYQRNRTMKGIERQEDEPFIAAQQDQTYTEPEEAPEQEYQPRDESPREIRQELEKEADSRRRELEDPNNVVDPDIDLEESIVYYSPVAGHYIIENAPEI
jgi:hypothetical protein